MLAFIGGIGTTEMIIIGVIGVLLFGNRLPGVMRSLGSSLIEFKKGVQGIEEEVKEVKEINRATNKLLNDK